MSHMAYKIDTEFGKLPPSLTDELGEWAKFQELAIQDSLRRSCKFKILSCDTSYFVCPSCTARSIQELDGVRLQCPNCGTWFSTTAMKLLRTDPLTKMSDEERKHHERVLIAGLLKRRADDLLRGHIPNELDKLAARYF